MHKIKSVQDSFDQFVKFRICKKRSAIKFIISQIQYSNRLTCVCFPFKPWLSEKFEKNFFAQKSIQIGYQEVSKRLKKFIKKILPGGKKEKRLFNFYKNRFSEPKYIYIFFQEQWSQIFIFSFPWPLILWHKNTFYSKYMRIFTVTTRKPFLPGVNGAKSQRAK